MRRLSLLLLVLSGCGGRDPLYGVQERPPSPGGADASAGAGTGGSPGNTAGISGTAGSPGGNPGTGGAGTKPPPLPPDAGVVPPPVPRDAAPPPPDTAPSTGACQFPKCVGALMASCTPSGRCMQQLFTTGGGLGSNACYSNGVKVVSSLTGGRNQRGSIKVFKADGTLCYTVEPEQRGGGVNAILYRDASGQPVASATVDRSTLSVACAGTTTPQSVASSCQPGLQSNGGGCTTGMCM